ncbi:hypothetical protein BH11BAC7_BH11BAC7_06680 [soil metagenome]
MRKFFLPILIFLIITSCGKKKTVIAYGTESWPEEGIEFLTELYVDHDSAFISWTNKKTGRVLYLGKAASMQDLKDSTFTRNYFYDSGKLHTIEPFRNKKMDGEVLSFYKSGKKKSRVTFSDGIKGNYETWYESGKLMIKGELLPDSTFSHKEYYENGVLQKEMITDKTGKGSFSSYSGNGKIYESGALLNFERSGIWKIFDSLGNPRRDTLFGIEKIEKRK